MVAQRQVKVNLGPKSYDIKIGSGLLKTVGSEFSQSTSQKLYLLYDENVREHFHVVEQQLSNKNLQLFSLEIPAGEQSKSIEQADRIWQFLAENQCDRKSTVVAIGGGVIGDLAGFVAATYARGVSFYQIPTTLLSHVDSSVGGKTGINLPAAKNMVGAFWQPSGVLIDVETLNTLPDREYISGLAEVIKYGLIMDEDFFARLEKSVSSLNSRDPETLVNTIAHCCRLKADVVEEDEHETSGRRAILNYGHTFAHAFETVFGYGKYLHGEAVSIGMMCAAELARRLGKIDQVFVDRQRTLLQAVKLPVTVDRADVAELINVMRRDKKNTGNIIRFILPTRIGHVELVSDAIDEKLIAESIEKFQN